MSPRRVAVLGLVLLVLLAGQAAGSSREVASTQSTAAAARTWVGHMTITSASTILFPPLFRAESEVTARLTNIGPAGAATSAVEGAWIGHRADVALTYSARHYGPCSDNTVQLLETVAFTYSGPSEQTSAEVPGFVPRTSVALELRDAGGRTYLTPQNFSFTAVDVGYCGSLPPTVPPPRQSYSAMAYEPGRSSSQASPPLVDDDPDPNHLVGTTTYDVGSIPGGPSYTYGSYRYSVSYDLRANVDLVPLTVDVNGRGRYGAAVSESLGLSCGLGASRCTALVPRGTTVVLAAVLGPTGTFQAWQGCDVARGRQCTVTVSGPRTVTAHFGYDFVGQAEPPPNGLFELTRKAEIADQGATAAADGSLGCGLTAAVLAAGIAAPAAVVVGAGPGVLTRSQAVGQLVFEESFGACAEGVVKTISYGVLLSIDPPDPAWRQLALAEPLPRGTVGACGVTRTCPALLQARRALVDAQTAVVSREEALAVAANRYGNAVGRGDRQVRALHSISQRVLSGQLADAYALRDLRARQLVAALRASGVRSMVVPRQRVAQAISASAAGKGVPASAVDRLLRKKLVTSRTEVASTLRAHARRQPVASVDVLARLSRPTPTSAMRRDARTLTLADLVALVRVLRQQRPTAPGAARDEADLRAALRCDASSVPALRSLAARATSSAGLGGDAGQQVAWVARMLAGKGTPVGPVCGV